MFQAFGKAFMAAVEPIRPALDPIINGAKALYDWVSKLLGPVREGSVAWEQMGANAGKAVGDLIVKIATLPGEMFKAGVEAGKKFVEGIKQAFADLWEWLSSLPAKIVAAIGKIDLSGIIKWPTMPSFLGGGSPSASAASPSGGVEGRRARRGQTPVGTRAEGGPVTRGAPYLVGERGPELFVPDLSGVVVTASETARLMRAMRSDIAVPNLPQPRALARPAAHGSGAGAADGRERRCRGC